MQTFLPDRSFQKSAALLDSRRLNKQRIECKQIYFACTGMRELNDGSTAPALAWSNHPAVRMWRNYEHMLCMYATAMCLECNKRGIADNVDMLGFFTERAARHPYIVPHWMLDAKTLDNIAKSHRLNLLRKDFDFYSKVFPGYTKVEAFTAGYVWPA